MGDRSPDSVDPRGLTTEEAARRIAQFGPNETPQPKEQPWRSALAKLWAPVPGMLEATILLEAALGKWTEALIVAALLAFNVVVSFIQENRAHTALALLRSRLTVRARVLRDAAWQQVAARELVPGDLIHLRMGDVVPADVRLSDGQLQVGISACDGGGMKARRMRWTAVLALLAAIGLGSLWSITPSGAHVQHRVESYLGRHDAPLLTPSDIPPRLAEAIIATEDERFYQHHGIDVIGIGRAALFDAAHRCWCQGASTITQQLVKDIYLRGSDRGFNKMIDAVVAFKVESIISKQQILADYLSEIPTGPGLYGIEQASCAYFGVPASQLDLADDALLAGLAQAPSAYDPVLHPRAATTRRDEVLNAMLAEGDIGMSVLQAARDEPILTRSRADGC